MTYCLDALFAQLPTGLRSPEISKDSDDDIRLDWDYGASQCFTFSLSNSGEIHFSGISGPLNFHGSISCKDDLPEIVLTFLKEIAS